MKELAEERINALDAGIYLVDITVGGDNRIFVEIDKEVGYVSIEECISVSRNIEHNLDREVEDFSLEVSSAGIDKPFRVIKQYLKHIGKNVTVQTVEHGKKLEGLLKSADEKGIVLEISEKRRLEGKKKKVLVTEEFPLTYDEIKETKLVIAF